MQSTLSPTNYSSFIPHLVPSLPTSLFHLVPTSLFPFAPSVNPRYSLRRRLCSYDGPIRIQFPESIDHLYLYLPSHSHSQLMIRFLCIVKLDDLIRIVEFGLTCASHCMTSDDGAGRWGVSMSYPAREIHTLNDATNMHQGRSTFAPIAIVVHASEISMYRSATPRQCQTHLIAQCHTIAKYERSANRSVLRNLSISNSSHSKFENAGRCRARI